MLKKVYYFAIVVSIIEAYQTLIPNVNSRKCKTNSRRELGMKVSESHGDNIGKMESQRTDFSIPTNSFHSQKSMISRGVGFAGALLASGLWSVRPASAADTCVKCGVEGCASPLCNNVAPISEAWYNPDNERIFDTFHKSYLPPRPELYLSRERLEGKKIITIGETHTNPLCHKLELDVIRALAITSAKNGDKMAIGLECFFRQHQGALDRFVFVHHDLAILKRETDWDKSWGYDLNFYAKIFNFASINGIRLIGLNVPTQVAALVGQVGLSNIPSKLKSLLPAVDLDVVKHKEQFEAAIGAFGGHGSMSEEAFSHMYEVQTLWDEYMAESVAMYAEKHSDDLLVVIAGVGHVAGRVGIPDRISRRVKSDPFVIVPQQVDWIASSGLPDVTLPLSIEDCDWAWYTERELVV
jgi:uncharacterized iron-regulated protein